MSANVQSELEDFFEGFWRALGDFFGSILGWFDQVFWNNSLEGDSWLDYRWGSLAEHALAAVVIAGFVYIFYKMVFERTSPYTLLGLKILFAIGLWVVFTAIAWLLIP